MKRIAPVALMLLLAAPALAGGSALRAPTAESSTYEPARSLAPLVDAVRPAVVAIQTEGVVRQASLHQQIPPEFRGMFGAMGDSGPRMVRGEGSGFLISAKGQVLTNHHVIAGAQTIRAVFADGTTVELELIGSDESTDIALLQLPAGDWDYVNLETGSTPRVGDRVVAIGNALGMGTTVTTGIISARGRQLHQAYDDFLQTDAAINQGNSGGPLFDLDGRVVGINTAIIQGANTVGFAIPISTVQRVVADLETAGSVQRGFLGVTGQPLTQELAHALELPDLHGALIKQVYTGTPADKAGLRSGDVVREINGDRVQDSGSLTRHIGMYRPGDRISLDIVRDGKPRTVVVSLVDRPGQGERLQAKGKPGTHRVASIGVSVLPVKNQRAQELRIERGVEIQSVDPNHLAAKVLQPHDIVLEVNGFSVGSSDDMERALRKSTRRVTLVLMREGRVIFQAIPLTDQ